MFFIVSYPIARKRILRAGVFFKWAHIIIGIGVAIGSIFEANEKKKNKTI